MKKIIIILLVTLFFSYSVQSQPTAGIFQRICESDVSNNYPTVVKAFNDGLYVAATVDFGSSSFYATLSKYDLTTGVQIWSKYFEVQSQINDFEYEPSTDDLFIVGHSLPLSNGGSSLDNYSFIASINGSGVPNFFHRYNHTGREAFNKIIRHPNPCTASAPFYILGSRNPSASAPSSQDEVILYNMNNAGNLVWGKQYSISPPEDEFARGIFPFGNSLFLVGNDIANNGVIVNVGCLNLGGVITGYSYPYVLDIYSGIDLQNGLLALVGEDFSVNEAFLMVVDQSSTSDIGLQFSDITRFKDIYRDQFGKLYTVGENKNLNPPLKNYQVVHNFTATPTTISLDWARFIVDASFQETSFSNGVISVTPTHDRIFYADARMNTPVSTPNLYNMHVGSYPLNLGNSSQELMDGCVASFPSPNYTRSYSRNQIPVAEFTLPLPPPILVPVIEDMFYSCNDFCELAAPCVCDSITYTTQNCYQAQFMANCTGSPTSIFTYEWDINCDGIVEAVSSNPSFAYTFPCGGGIFQVGLNVYSNGVFCHTICDTITISSDCCGTIIDDGITCTPVNDTYAFTIEVGNSPGAATCTQPVISSTNSTLSPLSYLPGTNSWIISGNATPTAPITTTVLQFTIQTQCICPVTGAPMTCTLQHSINLPCCKEIMIDDAVVCFSQSTFNLPIQVVTWPPLNNINHVTWYMLPKPASGICPPQGSPPYFVYQQTATSVLTPLHLYPDKLTTDVCVYAVVDLNDGPCTQLISNVATINLCEPTTCSLNSYEYCYSGTPIIPGPLNLTLNSPANACIYNIEWFDTDGISVQSGDTTFTPVSALVMADPINNCYEDFYYTVLITDSCGQRSCQAQIRLYSDTASIGSLVMEPFEQQPLCFGEDATLKFYEGCVGIPPQWEWYEKDCFGGSYSQIPNSGTTNPYLNTNRLYQSMWYMVKSHNGTCPDKTVELKIEVKDPSYLINFTAVADPCVEQYVNLSATVSPCVISCSGNPPCNCTYTMSWYKDGFLIGQTNGGTTQTFSYTTTPLYGNYYAIITEDCCPKNSMKTWVETFGPSCDPEITGPCFICDSNPVTLNSNMIVKPCGFACSSPCTLSWYLMAIDPFTGNIVPSVFLGNTPSVTVTTPGTYYLASDCNGCIKSTQFNLKGCTSQPCGPVSIEEIIPHDISHIKLMPNPAFGEVMVIWDTKVPDMAWIFLTDLSGQQVMEVLKPIGTDSILLDVSELPAGLYFVKVQSGNQQFAVAKLIKH